jgi:hypothetical protein
MTQVSQFWLDVKEEEKQIEVAVASQTRQPSDGVYIITVRQRGSIAKPGVVSLAPRKLAAQRIVEGSHVLCTDDQIVEYEAAQEKKRNAAGAAEVRSRNIFAITPPTK